MLLGIDTGGTFTDFVLFDGHELKIHKVLSTPAAPEQAILQGIAELSLMAAAKRGEVIIIHGSTVATNAALEGKGVRTAFITNRGFGDMLTIGRQQRRELYNLQPALIDPPVPLELCLEVDCRLAADGTELSALTATELAAVSAALQRLKPDAVAINLLFSFLDDRQEKALEAVVPAGIFCTRSSFVLPEYKEYERGLATWLNAWLGPLVARYLTRLQQHLSPSPIAVMQSSGGTIDAGQAARRAVNMLLSGPAGGLAAARFIGTKTGQYKLMTFDMGGTSSDVALIDGDIQLTNEGSIGHYPVAVPMVDMHSIGAGGGSIASIDAGGLLQVGPASAGAEPGPACYGRGGLQATVSDANAVLGRLRPDALLGGTMQLDIDAARAAIQGIAAGLDLDIETTALGILQIANEHMARALRVISVQRGHDPAVFSLCCFGGAGGLHVCALAESLGVRSILVPRNAGVLCAMGMLVAPRERQLSLTYNKLLSALNEQEINQQLQRLYIDGQKQLAAEGIAEQELQVQPSLDLRYQGQSFTLNIPWQGISGISQDFHSAHQQRYGHSMPLPIELVNVRLALRAEGPPLSLPELQRGHGSPAAQDSLKLVGFTRPVALYDRRQFGAGHHFDGPALVTEQTATTLVAENWRGNVDALGNLQLIRRYPG